jgi:hypothetical protein
MAILLSPGSSAALHRNLPVRLDQHWSCTSFRGVSELNEKDASLITPFAIAKSPSRTASASPLTLDEPEAQRLSSAEGIIGEFTDLLFTIV